MLTERDLSALLAILNDDGHSLEALVASFGRTFPKTEHFRIGCGLMVLLQDNMLTPPQRLVAQFFLWDMYKADGIAVNPFLPVFLEIVTKPSAPWERNFLGYAQGPTAMQDEGLYGTTRNGKPAASTRLREPETAVA
jgi:hypothetical protein